MAVVSTHPFRKKKSITLKELSMGSICWPFFIKKLLYRDSIVLFGYTLKVEKLNNCVCACMFGFCEDFHELSLQHLHCLYYWKPPMVLDFSINLKWYERETNSVHLKTHSTKWNRYEGSRFECFWSCIFFLHLNLDIRWQKTQWVKCV